MKFKVVSVYQLKFSIFFVTICKSCFISHRILQFSIYSFPHHFFSQFTKRVFVFHPNSQSISVFRIFRWETTNTGWIFRGQNRLLHCSSHCLERKNSRIVPRWPYINNLDAVKIICKISPCRCDPLIAVKFHCQVTVGNCTHFNLSCKTSA